MPLILYFYSTWYDDFCQFKNKYNNTRMSMHSFDGFTQIEVNEQLRNFKRKNYEAHAKQKSSFKKLMDLNIEFNVKDANIAKMIEHGIPSVYRETLWPKMMENVHGITLNFYQILLNKAIAIMNIKSYEIPEQKQKQYKHLNSIEQDIERTFPQLKLFTKQNEQGQALFNILSAWTVFREDIGYLQGMSQIAGFLLVELKETESFPIFCSIMTTDVLYSYYSMDLEEMQKFQHAFEQRLKRGNDKIYSRLKSLQIESRSYLFGWILTLFTRVLNIETIGGLWDIIFLHQISHHIMLQISYNLVVHHSQTILNSNLQAEQIIQSLKSNRISQLEGDTILTNLRNHRF